MSPRRHGLLPLAGAALLLGGAGCSAEEGTPRPAPTAAVELPDPVEAGLVSPEEAARTAQETIDAANAEAELERLRREIEQG